MMGKSRLEAFSDGVLAIIITIMVLELKVPHGIDLAVLRPLIPVFLSYVLSFVYIGIYWNNHHHLLHACRSVSASVLWANLHLLFWLSLVPFTTGWMGENHFEALPTAAYGVTLLMAGFAYWVLQGRIIKGQGEHSPLKQAIGHDLKGNGSLVAYIVAIALAQVDARWSLAIYVAVATAWVIPDRRIERMLAAERTHG
jgi:uncharacterized membrane protein